MSTGLGRNSNLFLSSRYLSGYSEMVINDKVSNCTDTHVYRWWWAHFFQEKLSNFITHPVINLPGYRNLQSN